MPKLIQLTVACEDRPGALARIARVLGSAKINILALLATTAGEAGFEGFVGLVVDQPDKAKKLLEAERMRYTEQSVLHIELPNTPGALARFLEKIAKEGINITAAYETSVHGAKTASVVLAVSDFDKAASIH
jgi:hypothetical protein